MATSTFAGLTVERDQLDAGNDPILAYARELLADPSLADRTAVTFEVRYAEGDQDRDGAYSSPDTITVTRDGEVFSA